MDALTIKLLEILKNQHGEYLDLKNDVYYLFLSDGLFSIYLDEDELKVGIDFLPRDNTFVYSVVEESLEDILSKQK